ncbi:hypothetical protein CKM354_000731100 [Cercospora kikuchii]|uniref:Uncharacterized protein n=1 Tax=Cercospora kikuchii TaxID=84275 RepID=A0A9P3FHD3_9PEZI|nr:uncharacterized protein CKM354_000731100 [Cercospora kikuchii]GIZ44102.1 hypothetical protein CKM354_000731100 [Cercospora kikuchii]
MRAELAEHIKYLPHLDNACVRTAVAIQELKNSLCQNLGPAGHQAVDGNTCDCLHKTAVTILAQLANQRVSVDAHFTSQSPILMLPCT